jgi:hypothetical protein
MKNSIVVEGFAFFELRAAKGMRRKANAQTATM